MKKKILSVFTALNIIISTIGSSFGINYCCVNNKDIEESIKIQWQRCKNHCQRAMLNKAISLYQVGNNSNLYLGFSENKFIFLEKKNSIKILVPIYFVENNDKLSKKYLGTIKYFFEIESKNKGKKPKKEVLSCVCGTDNNDFRFIPGICSCVPILYKPDVFPELDNVIKIINETFEKSDDMIYFEGDDLAHETFKIVKKSKDGHIQKFSYNSNNNKLNLIYDSDNDLINIVKKWFTSFSSNKKILQDYKREEEKQKLKQF